MAKRKKRRNQRRSKAARLSAKFTSQTHHQILNDAIRYEQAKEHQLNYTKVVANLEKGMLSRTLFVTGARDLNEPRNVQLLKVFFEQNYGPVEVCFVATYETRRKKQRVSATGASYPPARVRFRNVNDCEKVLRDSANSDGLFKCPSVGAIMSNSMIKVARSTRYDNMTKDVLDGNTVQYYGENLSLGHWIPNDIIDVWQEQDNEIENISLGHGITTDIIHVWQGQNDNEIEGHFDETLPPKRTIEWLEGVCLSDSTNLSIEMNLAARIIKIERSVTKEHIGDDVDFPYYLETVQKERTTFHFKEVNDSFELCKHNDGIMNNNNEVEYSLIMSLKNPPKIEECVYTLMDFCNEEEEEKWKRCIKFGNREPKHLNDSFAIRIGVSYATIETLLLNNGMKDLNKFGVVSDNFLNRYDYARNALHLTIRRIGIMEDNEEIQWYLHRLHNYDARLGKLNYSR